MRENFYYSPFEGEGYSSDMEQQLWEYIDGSGSKDQRKTIEDLLASQTEWKRKYQELLEVNQLLKSSELEQPSLRFAKNVMEEIGRLHVAPATRNYINKKIIWSIGGILMVSLIIFLFYGFRQINWSESGNNKLPVDFSKVDISKFFNNTWLNGFMIINIMLALFLLDNYLSNKRKQYRKQVR